MPEPQSFPLKEKIDKREKQLSHSAIKGYRSMLSLIFRTRIPEISSSTVIKDLLRSFEIKVLKTSINPPSWDLNKVLFYLMEPPFEPLNNSDLRTLTMKVLFLVALATAKRVGELQAISKNVARQGDSLSLSYVPEFLAKTESASNPLPRSFMIKSLKDFAGDLPEGSKLCPVRAIKHYLTRTASIVDRPRTLFVSPNKPSRSITKNAISFFLRKLICDAGASHENEDRTPRAHSIRSMGTSVAFLRNWKVSSILTAATWKSPSVFTSFYLKDIEFQLDEMHSLGPFVAAGQVVNSSSSK